MLKIAFAATFLVIATGQASAIELPRLDPEPQCDTVARRSGSGYEAMRHACINWEQSSYDRLKETWDSADEADQRAALASIRRFPAGANSYRLLEAALSGLIERRAAIQQSNELKTRNHFRAE